MHQPPHSLITERLELIVLTAAEVHALIQGDTEVAGARIRTIFPPGWPSERDARDGLPLHLADLERGDDRAAWHIRVIAELESRQVVGSINLKGPPDSHGEVEIGWGVVESSRLRGYGSEAAAAVAAWAWMQSGVNSLSATIPDDNVPSQRIATRLGLGRTTETRRDLPIWRCYRLDERPLDG